MQKIVPDIVVLDRYQGDRSSGGSACLFFICIIPLETNYFSSNTYLYYKLSTNPKSRLDKELLSVFAKEAKSALEIIKEISDFSQAYAKILNEENKYLYCLKYLKHRIYWVSIMSTALFTNYPKIEELKELLVAYYYQNWIAGATVARIKQTSFNVLKLIKSNAPISDIK